MSKVNILFVISQVTAQNLKKNFQLDENDNYLRDDLTEKERFLLRENFSSRWEPIDIGGTIFIPLSFYIDATPVSDTDSQLKWLKHIQDKFPNKLIVIGVWDITSAEYGTVVIPATHDIDGNEITSEEIIGTPIYPIHPRALEIMPNGIFERVSSLMGWKERRWA